MKYYYWACEQDDDKLNEWLYKIIICENDKIIEGISYSGVFATDRNEIWIGEELRPMKNWREITKAEFFVEML